MPDSSAPPGSQTIVLPGGVSVPISTWTRTGFSIIAVVAIAFGVYRYFFPPIPELVTVKQANEQLLLEVSHYNQHIVDTPVSSFEDDLDHDANAAEAKLGHVTVRVFADGCLLVSRRGRVGVRSSTRLLLDPAMLSATTSRLALVTTAYAQAPASCARHPANVRFKSTTGKKVDACWVEIIRQFEDGCVHVQLFNTCNNTWATEQDGSPQVRWTRCVH